MENAINDEEENKTSGDPMIGGVQVGSIAGTLDQNELLRFKKLIFRATRGNALTYFKNFKAPMQDFYGKDQFKSVYVVVFQEGEVLREKIGRICDSFMGERYDIPSHGIQQKIEEIENRIQETKNVI